MATNSSSTHGMSESYNENSDPQLAIINLMKPYIQLGIHHFDPSSSSLVITDFGSSQGKNSIKAMKFFIDYLRETDKLLTSPLVVHNDLPTNDWTTLFQLLAEDNSYQGVANGYSFYRQCLPSNSLSIGFTSSSMHWLSKLPCPITNHCFFTYAKEDENQALKNQSKLDFNTFIEHRSHELVPGGVLVLSIPSIDDQGRESTGNYFDQLYSAAELLFTEQELLHLTIPIYLRSLSECLDRDLFERCSLKLIEAELVHLKVPTVEQYYDGKITVEQLVKIFTKVFQSTMDSLVKHVLQINGRPKEEINQLIEKLWSIYEQKLGEKPDLILNRNQYVCVCLVLKKI